MVRRTSKTSTACRTDLGQAIKAAVNKNRSSITKVAAKLGFSRTTVMNWLANGFPVDQLPQVLEVVGIPYSGLEDLERRFEVKLSRRSSWAEPRAQQTPGYVKSFFDGLAAREVYFLGFFDLPPLEWARAMEPGARQVVHADLDAAAIKALGKGAHFLYLCPSDDDWVGFNRLIPVVHTPLALCRHWLDSLGPDVRRENVHLVKLDRTPFFYPNMKQAGKFRINANGSVSVDQVNMLIPTPHTRGGGEIVSLSPEHGRYIGDALTRLFKIPLLDELTDPKRAIVELLPKESAPASAPGTLAK